jgi:glutamine synthetase
MCSQANPLEEPTKLIADKQTVELRSADGSASIYQLLAGMVVAARTGFEREDALKRAEELYVSVNIHNDENRAKLESLQSLPDSCDASAKALDADRATFEAMGIFSPQMIDGIISRLKSYRDKHLRSEIGNNRQEMLLLVSKYWHCG